MKRSFLDELNNSPELDDLDKEAVSDLYNTVYGDNSEEAKLVDLATNEPPSLAEFETLGEHPNDNVQITEKGMKMTQTLPDGTDVTTVK